MKLGMVILDELQKIKEEMDRPWDSLFEENPRREEQEIWQLVERIPKFEGTGRRSLKSRSNKSIKF